VNNQNPSLVYIDPTDEKILLLWDVETSPKKKVQYRTFKGSTNELEEEVYTLRDDNNEGFFMPKA